MSLHTSTYICTYKSITHTLTYMHTHIHISIHACTLKLHTHKYIHTRPINIPKIVQLHLSWEKCKSKLHGDSHLLQ